MLFDFDNEKLPKVYLRNNKEYYLDSIRKKLILVTPEETVRQKWISFLKEKLFIPECLISVEEHLSHYGIQSNKRADIIIKGNDYQGNAYPLCIVECKAPDVPITERTQNQVFDYCNMIGADYAIITNGYNTHSYKYNERSNQYFRLSDIPTYKEILNGEYVQFDWGEYPERIPFEDFANHLDNAIDNGYIGETSNKAIALAAFNLLECFLDFRVKIPTGNYGTFKVIEDYGVRMLDYGNHSGGVFSGPYRSFLINNNENTEFISLSISAYQKSASTATALCVAIDNDEHSHHALQLVMDENVKAQGNICEFYHHGKIAIGNMGSGKISELRSFVEKYCPELIDGKRFYFGSLTNDHLWRLDDPKVIGLVANLISYALIRDEYRKFKKAK